MSADNTEPQAQVSECGLGSEQIDRAVGKDRSRPAMNTLPPEPPKSGMRVSRRTYDNEDGVLEAAYVWLLERRAQRKAAEALAARERLIAERKLPRATDEQQVAD